MTDPLLLRFLMEREAECPLCTYSLKGLTADQCPECGVRLELAVGASERRLAAWVTGVVTVALPTGFFLAMSALLLRLAITQRGMPPARDVVIVAAGATVGSLLLASLLVFRKRFRRLQRGTRWAVALGAGGTMFTIVVVLLTVIR